MAGILGAIAAGAKAIGEVVGVVGKTADVAVGRDVEVTGTQDTATREAGIQKSAQTAEELLQETGQITAATSTTSDIENLMNQLRSAATDTSLSAEEKQASLENILGQMTQTIGTKSYSLSQEQIGLVENQLGVITQALNKTLTADYSPEKAAQLATNARNAAIQEVLKAGMNEVADIEVRTGAYDSTVSRDLAMDLSARAATKGAEVELDTQALFAGLENQRANVLAGATTNLLGILKGAETATEEQLIQATEQATTGEQTTLSEQQQQTQTQEQQQMAEQRRATEERLAEETRESERKATSIAETETETKTEAETTANIQQFQDEKGLLDKLFGG